jgi:hypothetical protein
MKARFRRIYRGLSIALVVADTFVEAKLFNFESLDGHFEEPKK